MSSDVDESPTPKGRGKGGGRPKKGEAKSFKTIIEERQLKILNGPNRKKAEKADIAKVKAYQARWGADNKPTEKSGIEGLRALMWRKTGYLPKCHSCHVGRRPNPTGDQIPIGLDDSDLLPCGCAFKPALLEELLALKGYKPHTSDGKPIMIAPKVMEMFADFVFNVLGCNSNINNLLDRSAQAQARLQSAERLGDEIVLDDNYV